MIPEFIRRIDAKVKHADECGIAAIALVLSMAIIWGDNGPLGIFRTDGPWGIVWQIIATGIGVYIAFKVEQWMQGNTESKDNLSMLNLLYSDLKDNQQTLYYWEYEMMEMFPQRDSAFRTNFMSSHLLRITKEVISPMIRLQSCSCLDRMEIFNGLWKEYVHQIRVDHHDHQKIDRVYQQLPNAYLDCWNHIHTLISEVEKELGEDATGQKRIRGRFRNPRRTDEEINESDSQSS